VAIIDPMALIGAIFRKRGEKQGRIQIYE